MSHTEQAASSRGPSVATGERELRVQEDADLAIASRFQAGDEQALADA